MNKKQSYAVRAVSGWAVLLAAYLLIFFLFADLKKNVSWIGFGFSVISLLVTGSALWFGITLSDSLQTAMNFYESLHMIWLYPVLSVAAGAVGAFLPEESWKIVTALETIIFVISIIYGIVGTTAAIRMTELDQKDRKKEET